MIELFKVFAGVVALVLVLILVLTLGHTILVILGIAFLVYAICRGYSFLNDGK